MRYETEGNVKSCTSDTYNWVFNSETGFFARWGETMRIDPFMAPSPEILDIEISTVCNQGCEFCYKSNTGIGRNMSLETFKDIFSKFDDNLTQIAFGIGDVSGNPDLYRILQYTRDHGVIPNITINGARMSDDDYTMLAELCGAIAVSHYDDDLCFNAVERLTGSGCKQVNIHQLLSEETFDECIAMIDKVQQDPRLENLNAVVFLWLKPKGSRNTLHPLSSRQDYSRFVNKLLESGIRFGFDSCGASNFAEVLPEEYKHLDVYVEPCESSLFSFYINVDGIAYPCSFAEGCSPGIGLDVKAMDSFADVWNNGVVRMFRYNLLAHGRSCPIYDLELTA